MKKCLVLKPSFDVPYGGNERTVGIQDGATRQDTWGPLGLPPQCLLLPPLPGVQMPSYRKGRLVFSRLREPSFLDGMRTFRKNQAS